MDRATLKIEIPFTDHAHCIGRQGNQIQRIMSNTDTHIHFPDGNRDPNSTIKSNQVSITGSIISIEHARELIKEILPMSLKFLLPWKHVNNDTPLFENVRERFGVLVHSRCYIKTGEVYCIIRGLIHQKELAEASEYLIQTIYGFQSSLIEVTCQIEVSEQHQMYLQTREQTKDLSIASIEEYTHTTIRFPTVINQGSGRRTSVIITGKANQVCLARKLFDLCLPIILTFEISMEKEPTREEMFYMKDQLNINTIIRTRKDKFGKFISLQTQEYNSEQLYHARSIILNLPKIHHRSLPMSPTDLSTSSINSILSSSESNNINEVKLSPIGYERSSVLKNPLSPLFSSTSFEYQLSPFSQIERNEFAIWSLAFDMNNNDQQFPIILDDSIKNISHFFSSSLFSI